MGITYVFMQVVTAAVLHRCLVLQVTVAASCLAVQLVGTSSPANCWDGLRDSCTRTSTTLRESVLPAGDFPVVGQATMFAVCLRLETMSR